MRADWNGGALEIQVLQRASFLLEMANRKSTPGGLCQKEIKGRFIREMDSRDSISVGRVKMGRSPPTTYAACA